MQSKSRSRANSKANSKAFACGEFISFCEKKKPNQRKIRPYCRRLLRCCLNYWPFTAAIHGALTLRIILMLRFNDSIESSGDNIMGFAVKVRSRSRSGSRAGSRATSRARPRSQSRRRFRANGQVQGVFFDSLPETGDRLPSTFYLLPFTFYFLPYTFYLFTILSKLAGCVGVLVCWCVGVLGYGYFHFAGILDDLS